MTGWPRHRLPGTAQFVGYRRSWLRPDLLAGLGVWAVLVPQGLAYGELAGLSPVTGLYTALAALVLYPLFGSSRYLHVGPDSSIAIVTAAYVGGLVTADPARAAALASLLALVTAGFLLVGAALRLDVVARLLSTPVLTGYLTGSAVVIAAGQLGTILAVSPTDPGGAWWQDLVGVLANLPTTNPRALLIGAATVLCVVALMRWAPRVPGILVAVTAATATVAITRWQDVVPVIGAVPAGIPVPALPPFALGDAVALLGAGASMAVLVFSSSMLTGASLARRDHERVSGRREFLGLASACVGSGLLHGFPANGSNSRTFVVADARARSQGANLVAAGLVAVTLLLLTPTFHYLPRAALGAVVLVAAVRMIDLAALQRLWHVRHSDFVLAAVTTTGVLVAGVLPGIAVGVAVSLLEVLRRAALPPTAVLGMVEGHDSWRGTKDHTGASTVPGLLVYRFDAPLFFANAAVLRDEVLELVDEADPPVRQVILNAEGVVDMDVTGAEALGELVDELGRRDVRLVLAKVRTSLRTTLRRLDMYHRIELHAEVPGAVAEFLDRTSPRPREATEHQTPDHGGISGTPK